MLYSAGVKITSDDTKLSDLTEYRLNCIKSSAVKLLKLAGYKINAPEGNEFSLHFSTKNGNKTEAEIRILCGPVINLATRSKEIQITSDDLRKLLIQDMQETSGGKKPKEALVESLVDSVIKTSFMQVNANQGVSLNFNVNADGPRRRENRSGVFLQYTCSRLAALRKKYEEQAASGIYPTLPQVENVEFSLLTEKEEWSLLLKFLLEFPLLIDRIAKDMTLGKSKLHLLCDFLSKLCSLFSVYYRKTRILLEPRRHLLPLIHARLLLAISIEQILDNGLAILNINKIDEM